jgi:hypothetical protein
MIILAWVTLLEVKLSLPLSKESIHLQQAKTLLERFKLRNHSSVSKRQQNEVHRLKTKAKPTSS